MQKISSSSNLEYRVVLLSKL